VVVNILTCVCSVRNTEIITSRKVAVHRLAKRKLQPLGIFVRFNFGSVCLRYILIITIPLHIEDFGASAIVFNGKYLYNYNMITCIT
jgi:hypothetical protein